MDLRQDPIPLLMLRLAVPASIGMLFSTLLTVVDTFYAGMLSPTALAALSLAGPVFFLIMTFGIGVAQASNALVGNRLGAEQPQQARELAMQCLSFAIALSVLAAVLAFLLTPWLFQIMGGEPPYLAPATAYMNVVLLGAVFFALAIVINALLNTRGDTRSYRNAQIAAFFANILLDPLFMFGFGLGVVGVAVATIFVQAGVVIYLLMKARKLDFLQGARWHELVPNPARYTEILWQSLPNTISMLLVALGSLIIVAFVSRFGEPAMAAYGIALRLEQLLLLPVIGLNIAALSLTGVNYGARQLSRVDETYRTALKYALSLMAFGGLVLLLAGPWLMAVFTDDPQVQQIGVEYLRFEAFILPAYGLTFMSASILQGLKLPRIALYFNLVRQVVAQLLLFTLVVDILNLDIRSIWGSVLLINWVMGLCIVWVVRHRLQLLGSALASVVKGSS